MYKWLGSNQIALWQQKKPGPYAQMKQDTVNLHHRVSNTKKDVETRSHIENEEPKNEGQYLRRSETLILMKLCNDRKGFSHLDKISV